MSKLADFLKSQVGSAKPANPDDPSEKISSLSNFSSGVVASSPLPGDLEVDAEVPQAAPLSAVQEAARADVLAQLDRNPAAQRTFTNRFEPDGSMIVTLAIRGVATGELRIAAEQSHQACMALISGMEGAARDRHPPRPTDRTDTDGGRLILR